MSVLWQAVVVVSFLVALLRGGRFREETGLRLLWLPPVALTVQWISLRFVPLGWQVAVNFIAVGVLLIFAIANLSSQGMRLILAGMVLNCLVMSVNGGRIPVDPDAAHAVGLDERIILERSFGKWTALTPASSLPFLADVIPVPPPIGKVISVGDIIAAAGVFLLVQDLMGKKIVLFRSEEA